ncbi:site-2 protease family protein [Kiritimatiella glycovorans]|uniref:Putative peptidase M50 n=1 Tax=Kiritimatiella glycovorans TaxID=1307763 RepID=A0A0G3EB84_9BACT|nr:site-2 protease family protein [Kiritimatiella glycovorans]AKJ63756.1 putative peptidase M50 [Kiritimatiella glycovorans]
MIKGSYRIATVAGIPIKVHLTLLLMLLLFLVWQGPLGLIIALGLFTSVALHELGHSRVALRKGCTVSEIMLLPIGGMAKMSNLPRDPADEFKIAIAGPLVSLGLSAAAFGLYLLSGSLGLELAAFVALSLAVLNLVLALFNLLPSFPMDGGRIFRAWLTPRKGRLEATRIASKIGRSLAVVFGIVGLFNGNLILVLIAVFIFQAAGAEYRLVRQQHHPLYGEGFGGPQRYGNPGVEETEISVGPPPYAQKRSPLDSWRARARALWRRITGSRS